MSRDAGDPQLGLVLQSGPGWPPHRRFPFNFGGDTVGAQLLEDLGTAQGPLVITGYASLEYLLDLLHDVSQRRAGEGRPVSRLRLLLGVEPTLPRRPLPDVGAPAIQQAISDYWLEQGISLLRCGHVLSVLELLDSGQVQVRSSDEIRVHAKIYATGDSVTLGSSNYTPAGLVRNLEANVRFEAATEPDRHREACQLAEALWATGSDFREGFRTLLEQLLQKVTWQEALARACADLLEGPWASRYMGSGESPAPSLWPAQEQGLAQALWVLENVGSVLVADATGSGKTRMAAHLLRALQDRNWRTGRARVRLPVLVGPPFVLPTWRRELTEVGEAVTTFSHGVLSRAGSQRRIEVQSALRQAQVLLVDEAHNFLNRASERSRVLYGNVADHVILLTATPINRGARDLLAIVDLLGADNFDEELLKVVWRLARARRTGTGHVLSAAETETIRRALQHFVVRRTKDDFQALVDREPDRYVNALGERCRFPRHVPLVFTRNDPKPDRQRAFAIREKAKNLRGLVNLQARLKVPGFLRAEGWTEDRFLRMRLAGATALAAYQVRSRLRSSRVALIEHARGTSIAQERFGIRGGKSGDTGDVLGTLAGIRGRPPQSALGIDLPDWLVAPDAHARAVDEEIATYEDIVEQAEHISDHRMDSNADYLLGLAERHSRIIAFDSHLISLHDLMRRLKSRRGEDIDVVLATGESPASRRRFSEVFALGGDDRRVIGLCSDALAEGMNLQGASAVVHLDLPSVIRVVEQRVGRVDRMDTSHEEIEVHWPEEPPEYSLRSDERLFWRLQEVEDLLGSNVPVPEGFLAPVDAVEETLPVRAIIEAVERGEAPEGSVTLPDAFASVRSLVMGPEAIVAPATYEALRGSHARVLASVAVVQVGSPWVFLAIGASDRSAPRWTFVDLTGDDPPLPLRDLDTIASALRFGITDSVSDAPFDDDAARALTLAVKRVEDNERGLLPRRKQRALDEMVHVLGRYRRDAQREGDAERLRVLERLLGPLEARSENDSVDWDHLAEWWLGLVRPEWYTHLAERRGRRPARLRDLRKRMLREPLSTERLATIDGASLRALPLERRVVAAIVGVA